MKVVILSDIHDNETNLKLCLKWCAENSIEQIICCGDLTNSQTLKQLSGFQGTVHLVKGNAEIYDDTQLQQYKNIVYYEFEGIFQIEQVKIGLCHEPFRFDRLIKKNVTIIFYGHTHRPWIEEKNSVKLINPGTLGGMFTKATFSYWDTKTRILELKSLDSLV